MQYQGTADPQTAQEVHAYTGNYIERFNKNDAAAVAALFTEDGILVTPDGTVFGRKAIEKNYAGFFQQWHPSDHVIRIDQINAVGNLAWKVGEWNATFQGPDGPLPAKGYFASLLVREGDGWKERMLGYNVASTPA
jgi:uncharacterized protein (TIGR02246 family)